MIATTDPGLELIGWGPDYTAAPNENGVRPALVKFRMHEAIVDGIHSYRRGSQIIRFMFNLIEEFDDDGDAADTGLEWHMRHDIEINEWHWLHCGVLTVTGKKCHTCGRIVY